MLQIQPIFRAKDQWTDLLADSRLSCEVLELSLEQKRDQSWEKMVLWYQETCAVSSFHGAFLDNNPVSADELIRNSSRKRCEESCALANRLGAEHIVFHSSCFPHLRGAYLDRWVEESAAYYSGLADRWKLKVYIENSLDVDPTPLQMLMKGSDGKLAVCLDTGHANLSRVPIQGWIEALGEDIQYLHLSDNDGAFDDHKTIGSGTIDWESVYRTTRSLGTDIPMTLEVGGPENIRESIRYLERNGWLEGYGWNRRSTS